MNGISKVALAAALTLGGVAMSGAPALAQKKAAKDQKDAGLKLSPDVLKAAQAAQTALAAKDANTALPLIAQAEAAAKDDSDKYIVNALKLQAMSIQLQGQPGGMTVARERELLAPIDALIANPMTPPTDKPRYLYQRGAISLDLRDYPSAISYLGRAKEAGYQDPQLAMQIVKAKMDSGDVAGGSADLDAAIAAQTANGGKADEQLYRYAIAKTAQQKLNAQSFGWLKKYVAAYPTAKNWRDAIVTYGLNPQSLTTTLDKPQKVDLYRLMRSTKSLADQYDYEIYAQWVQDLGLPYEAKTVVTEGKAAGKIPASSKGAVDLLKQANATIASEGSLAPQEAKAKAGSNVRVIANVGDAYFGSANYPKAIELYRLALQKGGVDADQVNTRLGMALAMSGDKEGARAAFAAVKGQPRADVAQLWTLYLDHPPTA